MMSSEEHKRYFTALHELVQSMNWTYGKGDMYYEKDISYAYLIGFGKDMKKVYAVTQNCTSFKHIKRLTVWPYKDKPEILFLGRRRRLYWEKDS